MPCPCNGAMNQLISKLIRRMTSYMRILRIFDFRNVFVVCIDIQNNQGQISATENPVHNGLVQAPGIYVVVGNSCKLRCDNRSNIIYIGSSENLRRRIGGDFIATLQKGNNQHSGAQKIRKAILINNISQTCLYIIGFPLKDAHKDKVEKLEGCFQAAYIHFYLIDPCFVDQTEDPDFTIFGLIPPDDARRTIQFILTTIDIFFRDCIRDC